MTPSPGIHVIAGPTSMGVVVVAGDVQVAITVPAGRNGGVTQDQARAHALRAARRALTVVGEELDHELSGWAVV